jgi:preprotein translocase subunit SecD
VKRSLVVSLVAILVIAFGGLATVLTLGWAPALGLDLQGGASVVLRPEAGTNADALGQAVQIIRNRVDGFGIAEAEVVRQGDAVVVNLPGVKNQDDALRLVGQTAQLEFRPVLASLPASAVNTNPSSTVPGSTTPGESTTVVANASSTAPSTPSATTAAPATTAAASAATNPGNSRPVAAQAATTTPGTTAAAPPTTAPAAAGGTTVAPTTTVPTSTTTAAPVALPTCANASDIDKPDQTVILPQCQKQTVVEYYQVGPTFLSGTAVATAQKQFDTQSGWTVKVTLKGGSGGMDTFNEWAGKCYNGDPACPSSGSSHGRIAIVLDGLVKSAPQVNSPTFTDNNVVISGAFTEGEAGDLALVLRYGALPVKLTPEAVQTVSPTLGSDSLKAAVVAGAVGIGLVLLLMFAYYRRLAVVVLLGLCVSGSLIWTIVCIAGQTRGLALTLAGITGLIVSVGVTVDSYVVYFERLKDDVRVGRSVRTSAERGFKSAWRTILAADLVSLFGAIILWWLTVGSVRGFAFFLGISTAVDMVVAYFYTRPAVTLLARSRFMAGSKVLGVTRGEAAAELAAGGVR